MQTLGARARLPLAFILGGASAMAFAPWRLWMLAPLCLVALHITRAWSGQEGRSGLGTGREALTGLCFGFGLMLCGSPWLYLGLYQGGHNKLIALVLVGLAMLFFALHHAAAFALSGWLAARCGRGAQACYCLLLFPACWVWTEWLRRAFAYDFPWFVLGESQVPGALLTGWAPVGGVMLVSYLLALCSGALALLLSERPKRRLTCTCLATLALCFGADACLRRCMWTEPESGTMTVAIVQTERTPAEKWDGKAAEATAKRLENIIGQERDKLIVTPETMVETPAILMTDLFWERLHAALAQSHSYLLLGIPTVQKSDDGVHIYNSLLSLGPTGFDLYRKQHLVPMAEHLPFKESLAPFYRTTLSYPLQDQSTGEQEWSRPLYASGYMFAPLICYDAVYGESAARQAVGANAIVNVSDDSWIDSEIYFAQNEQIAQARALETERPLLRANNVGHSAVIGPRGDIEAEAPHRRDVVLHAELSGRSGSTPYMRFGDVPVLLLAALGFFAALLGRFVRRGSAFAALPVHGK